ncbi:MAG: polysaccharide biosynthesis/export family protein [Desulfopila sp.]
MVGLRSFVLALVLVGFCSSGLFAAQSTTDMSASDAMKKQARSEILGGSDLLPPQDPEYEIGYGDLLDVQVYGEGSMAVSAPPAYDEFGNEIASNAKEVEIPVRVDGRASLKHLGDVDVVGMTLTQMADYLKILYKTVYADPIVTVVLVKSNSKNYTVMGKVVNPGVYSLEQPTNLVQVVARCGGFTEWANSEMTVIRKKGDKASPLFVGNTLEFDYDDFLDGVDIDRNVVIQSGDIVVVH